MLYLPKNPTFIANSSSQSENSSSQTVQDIYSVLPLEIRLRLADKPNGIFFFLGVVFLVLAVVVRLKWGNRRMDFSKWATPLLGVFSIICLVIGFPPILSSSRIETNIKYFKDEYKTKKSEGMNEMLEFANKRSASEELMPNE
jgi:hypothetical protein